MRTKLCLLLSSLLLALPLVAIADSVSFFPCVLEHSYAQNEYEEFVNLNLKDWYRAEIDDWYDDDLMVAEGSAAIVLDQSILIIDLHFSDTYDYAAHDTHLPEELTFFNHDPNDETYIPDWQVTIFPDRDDPYAFHYFGTFNWTMSGIYMYGGYTDSEGIPHDCFEFQIAVY